MVMAMWTWTPYLNGRSHWLTLRVRPSHRRGECRLVRCAHEDSVASLIEAIDIKRRTYFEHEGAPFVCLEVNISTPTARGGQTLVRVKMRNLLTRSVFEKSFRAGERFKEP